MKILYHPRSDLFKCGLLYNPYALVNIASSGWHFPTWNEYDAMKTWLTNNGYGYEGSGDDIAKSICSKKGWKSSGAAGTPGYDRSNNDSVHFSAVPAGYRYGPDGLFYGLTEIAQFAATYYIGQTYYRSLEYNNNTLFGTGRTFRVGRSVRLLKDSTTLSHGERGTYTGNDGQTYGTICIGLQEWTAENLKETKDNLGNTIPEVTDTATWQALTSQALCAYDNNWDLV